MRAAVLGADWLDSFANNIASGLRELGHTVVSYGDVQPRPSRALTTVISEVAFRSHALDVRWQDRLASRVLADQPDVVISADHRVSREAVERFRRAGIRTAMWFPDSVANLGRLTMLMGRYDVLAFKDPLLVARLQACYADNVRYLPEACNPALHRPPPGLTPGAGAVVVVGNMYASRLALLRRLHADGIPLRLYGGGFPRWERPGPLAALHTGEVVTGARKAEVFRGASAVLNNLHPAEMDGGNARLFEATGSGALVLSEARPALAELFGPDEVLSFDSYANLLAQARAASRGELDARAVGDRASARAHAEHSYADRLRLLLRWLE